MNKTTISLLGALAITGAVGCDKLWAPYIGWADPQSDFASCERALCDHGNVGVCAQQPANQGWRPCSNPPAGTKPIEECVAGAIELRAVTCENGMMPPAPDMMTPPVPPVEGQMSTGVGNALNAQGVALTCVPVPGVIVFQGATNVPALRYASCLWLKASDPRAQAVVRIRLLPSDPTKQYKLDPATVTDNQGATHGLTMVSDEWYWMNTANPRDRLITSNAKDSQSQPLGFRRYNPTTLTDEDGAGVATGTCNLP